MADESDCRLTSLSSCAGCAAKLGQSVLLEFLGQLPKRTDPNLLVGESTSDDAGVYQMSPDLALVQTVDFFTPIVDEPYAYGQIAAANALSDVYAMGGRPLTAMNLLAFPPDKVPPAAVSRILRGGASKARQAKCAIVGGHTIRCPEPIYGLSVTGTVNPRRVLTNAGASEGDLLVLTKPLGTGIATTAIKRGLASQRLARKVTALMRRLNVAGAALGESGLVRCATDVTGFGLLGHLANICRGSRVGADVFADAIPPIAEEICELIARGCIPGGTQANLNSANAVTDWGGAEDALRVLMSDAQTSGGLLLCVAPPKLDRVRDILRRNRTAACAVIGQVTRQGEPMIRVVRQ